MSGGDNRSDRDLLIKLETQFTSMNENFKKTDQKLEDTIVRLENLVKDLKDDLKNEYVPKYEFERLVETVKSLKKELGDDYAPLVRFEPVEEVHKDIAKRLRTLLITVGVCVLIAAASAPTWLAIVSNLGDVHKAATATGVTK